LLPTSTRQHRLAKAGALILTGVALKHALIQAGFKESTARNPTQNNLSVSQCLQAYKDQNGELDPRTLIERTHRIITTKLDQLEESNGKGLRKLPISQLAKLYDTLLKYHGVDAKVTTATRVMDLRERMDRMDRLKRELREHGSSPAVKVIDVGSSSKEDAQAHADE
jgi:hypothetical protein